MIADPWVPLHGSQGAHQCIHTSTSFGALSPPASVCSALAEDDAVLAEATTAI